MNRTLMRRSRAVILAITALVAASCSLRRASTPELVRPLPNDAWFAKQRMSSGEPIPVGALTRAMTAMSRGDKAGVAQRSAGGAWIAVGPTNIGGRLTSFAVDPNDSNHIWAGAAAGGVFESRDAGSNWAPVFDDQPLLPVGAVAAHPTTSNIVYVGTGEANGAGYSYDGDGVYRTVDGGASWQHLGLAETRRIGRIAIDPVDPQRVFVAAAGGVYAPDEFRGVYRSTDAGVTWTKVLFVAPTAGAIDVAIDPSNPARVYAAIWEHYSTPSHWTAGGLNSGIWQSQDGGDSWTRLTNGLPASAATVGRIGLAIAASSPQTVYALYINDPGSLIGVYKTTNAGASWARIDTPGGSQTAIFSGYGYYFGQIRVDPANANIVYLLDVYWARSTDGGVTYTNHTSGPMHVDHHDLAILPTKLYMANDGGFYRSTDTGSTWIKATVLPATQFYDLGINPTDTSKRFGGLQDNGSVRTIDGRASDWTSVNGGDGFQCEVDPVNPLRVYYESQYGGIRRSSDGGNTSAAGTTGIVSTDRKNWNTPIIHDPRTTQRLYTATHRVYRSTDGAQSWTAISSDLTDGPHPTPSAVPRGGDSAASHLGACPSKGPGL